MINPETINPFELPSAYLRLVGTLPPVPALYFAATDKILYIGITTNLQKRWIQHHKTAILSGFPDTKVHWLKLEDDIVSPELERQFIDFYNPPLNGRVDSRVDSCIKLGHVKLYDEGIQRIYNLGDEYPLAGKTYLDLLKKLDHYGGSVASIDVLSSKINVSIRSIQRATRWLHEQRIIPRYRLHGSKYLYCFNPDEVWNGWDSFQDLALFHFLDSPNFEKRIRRIYD